MYVWRGVKTLRLMSMQRVKLLAAHFMFLWHRKLLFYFIHSSRKWKVVSKNKYLYKAQSLQRHSEAVELRFGYHCGATILRSYRPTNHLHTIIQLHTHNYSFGG